MKDEDVLRMSRQIATFFAPYEEHEAVEGVANHIRQFWEPRMREHLYDLHARDPDRLHPHVRAAAETLKAKAQSS